MLYFNYFTDESVGPEEVDEAKVRSGSVKDFEEKPVSADFFDGNKLRYLRKWR